jgi:hypothetical protein
MDIVQDTLWHSKIHSAGHLPGSEPGPEYFIMGTRVGQRCSNTCDCQTETFMERQTNSFPRSINIHSSPDPKSSNPVFDDGTMVENGKIIFGVVEKKVGASQGGLVHVVFRKGPMRLGYSLPASKWLSITSYSIMVLISVLDSESENHSFHHTAHRRA